MITGIVITPMMMGTVLGSPKVFSGPGVPGLGASVGVGVGSSVPMGSWSTPHTGIFAYAFSSPVTVAGSHSKLNCPVMV